MATTKFIIGKGTQLFVALPPLGSQVEPPSVTLTVTNAAQVKDTTAPATITLSGAVAAGKLIAAGNYLNFVDPVTGKSVMVRVRADVEPTDTTIEVDTIPETIAASSVAEFPMRLSGRTAANIGREGNRIESVDFDSGGFATGLTSSVSQTIEMPGNFLANDGGFRTAEVAFKQLREVYAWIELPPSSAAYSKGKIYKGFCSISSLPVDIPADGIVTGNISLAVNGELIEVDEVPTA